MSFTDEEASDVAGRPKMESFLFSCELSSKVPFYCFQADEEDDLEHFIELRTVCLGEGAQEENNVVELIAMNHQGKITTVPIANLHIGCLPMVSLGDFELKAPVTVRLKAGSGPVTVSGLHLIASEVEDSDLEDEDEEDDDDDLEEDDDDLEEDDVSPNKPAKKKNK